jgi:catechol 2,3-dioxygenase-like lactoylglutathione lyase family enzyme
MLAKRSVVTFIPTTDSARSRTFYEETLELPFIKDDGFALVFEAKGVRIRVVQAPQFQPVTYTILGWEVPDIEAAIDHLAGRGVTFERFGFFEQDARGIWLAPGGDKVAWFKDPDGNTLSVSQHV